MRVWIDGWQLQCCGAPFEIGSRISWILIDGDLGWLRANLGTASHVDAREDHHDAVPEDTPTTRGTVRAIYVVTVDRQLRDDGAHHAVPGSAKLTPAAMADGRNVEPTDGYLVDLDLDID